ncbi:SIP domain-containing protein [Corynebacterium kalidii]|uniref:Siderophore-interacting protein n=1 Tax=Corynebacterium kalidii TaxID=2931982 RepID=A0A9X2AZA2_9CORY|nr:siderophore-interacting protein [Corynebacterium kalidii]
MPRISRDTDIYPITMRELEVLRIEDVTPGMRRVVFGGEGLREHLRDGEQVPAIVSDGFDDDMRMIFPHPVTGERPYPVSLGDGRLDWTAEVNELFRTYTVRRWTPEAGKFGELVVDFARHGAGLAEGWSDTASVGDRVYAAGPKNCASLPVHTDWLLLIGDETALPAIGRCLEELPAGHRVVAVVEVPERADIQHDLDGLATADGAGIDLRWVVRAEGGDFTATVAALAQDGALPGGTPFVWAAGEAGRLKTVRRFVKERGVPREHVQITGYWRRNDATTAGAAEGAANDGTGSGTGSGADSGAGASSLAPLLQLHELTEIAPGLALQAAARLGRYGLFEAVDTVADSAGGAASVDAVAEAVQVPEGRLVRFLRYLESLGLLALHGGEGQATVTLTALGEELADPDGLVARLAGPEALQALTWLHLDDGLRDGAPVPVGATGCTWDGLRGDDPSLGRPLEDNEATRAQWVAPALAARWGSLPGGAPASVAVLGGAEGTAAAVYADELLRRADAPGVPGVPEVTVLRMPGNHTCSPERLLAEVGESRRDRVRIGDWEVGDGRSIGADLVLLLDPYAVCAPGEVPGLLSSAVAAAGGGATGAGTTGGGRVVVVTRLLAESGDEDHDYEEDLTRMLVSGRSLPTARDLSSAVAQAGLRGLADIPVGWGSHAVVIGA